MQPAQTSLLNTLEPIAALSPGRVDELAAMCVVETVSQGLNPFRMNVVQSEQLLYLLKGDLSLSMWMARAMYCMAAAILPAIPSFPIRRR
jgi:hypothetical protein